MTHVSEAQALPLAEKALAGEFEWSKFAAASKTMRQRTAKAVGTVGELAQTFEMMEAAWSAAIHLLFGEVNDAGPAGPAPAAGVVGRQAGREPGSGSAQALRREADAVGDASDRALRRSSLQLPQVQTAPRRRYPSR